MKNRISILLLIILAICLAGISYFADAKAEPSNKTGIVNATQTNTQFSTTTSQDELNVYGTANLTENTPSGLSYRVTVTITSPSGRTNTTQHDWSQAPISHTTGLSIGSEDGTYNIYATVESQTGSYDEYNNFLGADNPTVVGNSSATVVVVPTIFVRNFRAVPNSVNAGGEVDVKLSFVFTRDVPPGTTLEVELVAGPTEDVRITRDTPTATSTGQGGGIQVVPNSGNRSIIVTSARPTSASDEATVNVNFPFNVSSNSASGIVSLDLARGNPSSSNVTVQPATLPTTSFQVIRATAGVCRPECYEPNQGCPCSENGG